MDDIDLTIVVGPTEVTVVKNQPELVGGETRCDCGWRLPKHIYANTKNMHIMISYECPECGEGFVMERDPVRDR